MPDVRLPLVLLSPEDSHGLASVSIEPEAFAAIRRHAEDAYPNEAIGLLGGSAVGEARIEVVVPFVNASRTPTLRAAATDADVAAALNHLKRRGCRPVGVYHSHPNGAALPSGGDFHSARETAIEFVTSVGPGGAGVTRAWVVSPAEPARRIDVVVGSR